MEKINRAELLQEWAESHLTSLIIETVDGLHTSLDRYTPFAETGIDSFRVLKIIKKLEEDFGRLPKTLLFENINIAELAVYFAKNHAAIISAKLGIEMSAPTTPQAPVIQAHPQVVLQAVPARAAPAAPATPVKSVVTSVVAEKPCLLPERDAYADPVLGTIVQAIFDQYKNEAGASRGARSIAPNMFIGSARRGFFNYARCKDIFLAYAYTGPDDYFPVLAEEMLAHCTAQNLQLNIFTDRVLGSVASKRFSSTPFGALQRIPGLGKFSLEGGAMRRLRYQVTKFEKAGAARTVEYRLGTDAAVERAIADVIDRWCAGKPMVNPLIHVVKNEILARTLNARHRLFLTYLDDVLQNVMLISPLGPDYNGYLMDLEFYGESMPSGGLEFAIVHLIEKLVAEGHDMLSMGGTYGCRLESCADADAGIDRILDDLHKQGIFNDDGNLQFKNKFRTDNRTIYLCRPEGSGKADNIIDVIMMIADPEAMQTTDAENFTHLARATPAAGNGPVQAKRATSGGTQALAREIAARSSSLEQVGFNPQNLADEQVQFDLKTDSWAQLKSPAIDAQISHLRSQLQTAAQVDDSLRSLFPFAHFVLTSSGRMAEEVFYKSWPRKGVILENVLFPSGLFHQIDNGFDPLELPCEAALQPQSALLFKGDLAWDAVVQRVSADPQSIAMVCIEVSNNATGGLPVSMRQLRDLKQLLAPHSIPLVIDGTRVLENAQFLIEHDPGFSGGDVWAVAKEILSCADAVTCSLAKDFGVNFGGLIATNDTALFRRLSALAVECGGGLDAIERKMVALSVQDRQRIETQVLRRMESVRLIWSAFHERGIPVAQPPGAHCILFDVKSIAQFNSLAHPVASFVAWFYLNTGIRVGAHSVGMQNGTAINSMVRLAVPLGLKAAQVEQIIRRVTDMFDRMENIPELVPESGSTAQLADVHARFALQAPHRSASAATPAPVVKTPASAAVQELPVQAAPSPTIEAAPGAHPAPVASQVPDLNLKHEVNVADKEPDMASQRGTCDIAVVGMAGRYPQANNLNKLWANLAQGVDSIEEIPAERLARRGLHGAPKRYRGGFIADVDRFDSLFFNTSPRDAEMMDPQERHFLEVAWEAMEDAGYYPETLVHDGAPRDIGVFVGAVWAMYQMVGLDHRHAGTDVSPNSFLWSVANHVSYCLNLCGPSMTVDTACSSSLTALYLACEAIYRGECSAAIVGGVNLDLHQGKYDINEVGRALSEDGVCRSFGKGANGYVGGEGIGAMLIKPLDAAIRDGDAIYGVIKGVSVNHGGRSSGYAVPSPNSQADVILAAIERSGVDPRSIGYIEAHGTGTELGDPIEIRGLSKAFEKYGVKAQACAIGSIKTNIGHLEAAAGIVGVSKVLLQMRHRQLAPSLHSTELNEFIDFANSPFYVVQTLEPWQAKTMDGKTMPLRAGISSFGAGGSNAHVIVESYQRQEVRAEEGKDEYVFPFSARNEDQLREVALRLRNYLGLAPIEAGIAVPANLANVAHTLQVGRKTFEFRVAILAKTRDELILRLSNFIDGAKHENLLIGSSGNAATFTKLLTRREQDEFVQMLAKGRDLRRLAQLWADGVFSEWRSKAVHQGGMRTHLPTYPFADRRHWAGGVSQSTHRFSGSFAALHPMLDANESTFERQIFKKSFHNRDFFIYDHLVSKIPTLPGVAYLEFARSAGEIAAGRKVHKIKNMIWLSPIVVHGSTSQEVLMELKPKGDVVHFEVFSHNQQGQRTLHAQGQLVYAADTDGRPESIDIEEIRARCTRVINGQDAYPRFNALGLGLGPSFQVLGEIRKNDEETLGQLRLSAARVGDLQELLLHPAMMDGSLQVGAASKLDDPTAQMAVPYSIGEVEILHPIPAQCWSYVKVVKDGKNPGSKVARANVLIVDDQGKILVRILETVGVPLTDVHKSATPDSDGGEEMLHYTWDWITDEPVADGAAEVVALDDQGTLLLFDAGPALAEQYRARLLAAGGDANRVILVESGAQYEQCDASHYRLNPADPANFVRLLDAMEQRSLRVGQVCFAWPVAQAEDINLAASLEQGVFAMLFFCQALAPRKLQEKVRLQYLFKSSASGSAAHHEAISGFANALRLEHQKVLCKTIELRAAAADSLCDIILAEFGPGRDEAHTVRYDGASRSVKRLKPVDLAPATGDSAAIGVALREHGVYLITGGLGGLGLLFAEYLAREYKARLVLTGRSELNPQQQQWLAGIEKLGAEVLYVRADVANHDQIESALDQARQRFGAIHGVIHSAGVLRDSYIRNKTLADMQAVMAPKVQGTLNLDQLTANDELDFFVLFSSMSAIGGNPGQSDYCYANYFMDSFAIEREAARVGGKRKGKSLSLNWSLWKNGGMKIDEQTERLFRKATGIVPLSTAAGIEVFVKGLATQHTQMVVVLGSRDMLELAWGLRKKPEPVAPAVAANAGAASGAAGSTAGGAAGGAAGSGDAIVTLLRRGLTQIAMDLLKFDESDVRTDQILLDLGFDSIGLATFANSVNEKYGLEITPILFFDYASIDEISKHLAVESRDVLLKFVQGDGAAAAASPAPASAQSQGPGQGLAQSPAQAPLFAGKGWNPGATPVLAAAAPTHDYSAEHRFSSQPIAIIGMSGVMPQSDDLQTFWENLREGKNLVSEIPKDRWSWEEHFGDPMKEPGKTNSKWGGFMSEVDKFDPLFFGISPREAQMMDPQQRLFLQTVWEAFEDTGHKVSDFAGTKTGLFVGAATNDYVNLINRLNVPINAYTASGNSHSVLANRVSFLLNLRGPSAPIDTACSSSLIALHRAIESIHTGSSDMAVVGGVQVMLTPAAHISFSMAGMLSDDGKCKTFDKRANGYVRGEGTGAIIIKPLAKAEADGDHIYAVVRATTENHGGRVTTLTAPNATAQAALLVEAYTKAEIDPTTVGYIECHGTGTSLGDPIEVQALGRAFTELYKQHGKAPATQPHCGLSSVKTNIGHLETAAGIAGIIKALLSIKNKQIAANGHFEEINPYINLKGTPFFIPSVTTDWAAPLDAAGHALPRRAGVSSFGFGGANSHVVLEEYLPKAQTASGNAEKPRVLVLSAKNVERLQAYCAKLLIHLDRNEVDLDRFIYTLQVGRDVYASRLAFVASNVSELRAKLAAFVHSASAHDGIYHQHLRIGKTAAGDEAHPLAADTVRELVAQNALAKLAEMWANGHDVDWTLLYSNGLPGRVSVPTYPFARERYWLPIPEAASVMQSAALSVAQAMQTPGGARRMAVLHPLVQHNTSTLQEQKFSTRLDGNEFFLEDHRVESQRILPGVAYMEMARAAGQFAAQRDVRFIRKLVWLMPLMVGDKGVQLDITLTPKQHDLDFEVRSMAGEHEVLHCSGKLGFGSGTQEAEYVDIDQLRQRCTDEVLTGDVLYAWFESSGLKLGPSFRIVQTIWANESESFSLLKLPAQIMDEVDRYVLHPALMDGALHCAIGMMKKGNLDVSLSLPFSVAEVEVFGSVREIQYSYATWADRNGNPDPSKWKVNFLFLDKDGRVLVRIREFTSRALHPGQSVAPAITGAKNRGVLHTLLPVWRPVRPERASTAVPADARVLLVGGNAAQLAWLQAAYPNAQSLAFDLTLSAQELETALKAATFDHLVWMAPDVGVEHPVAPDTAGLAVDLIDSQKNGVLAVFAITKALLSCKYASRDLAWTLITTNTQKVRESDPIQPAHAGVSGYFGSLAKEFVHWHLRLLDVTSLQSVSARECLAAPLAANGKGLVHRHGEWLEQELAVAKDLPQVLPAYRQEGVYVLLGGAGGIGEVFSRHLIERYQAKIVWIGRRACDSAIQEKIDALAKIGTAPLYFQADATDVRELARVGEQIRRFYPAIHGVVHSALVLRDQSLVTMDAATFNASFAAKVDTSVNLDRVFGGLDLDFMLFFSSILTFSSSAGQSNYAAGCAFKDAFARSLQSQRPYPVKIMNWGYWGNVGVVADAAYLKAMEAMGIGSVEPDEAMAQLELLVSSHWLDQLVVLKTVGARALASIDKLDRINCQVQHRVTVLPGMKAAATEKIDVEATGHTDGREAGGPAPRALPSHQQKGNHQMGRDQIRKLVSEKLSQALQLDLGRIRNDEPFAEYGVDSIVGVNLVRTISAALDIELEATSLFEYSTVNDLADYIHATFGDELARRSGKLASPVRDAVAAPRREPMGDPRLESVRAPIQRAAARPTGRAAAPIGLEPIRKLVAEKLSMALELDAGKIRNDEPFAEYGVDSIVGVNLVRTISSALEIELEATTLFEHSTVNDLADYIHATFGEELAKRAAPAGVDADATARNSDVRTRDAAQVATHTPQFGNRFEFSARSDGKQGHDDPFGQSAQFPHGQGSAADAPARNDEEIAIIGMSGRFAGSESLDDFWRNLRDGTDLVSEITRWTREESIVSAQSGTCHHGSFIDSVAQFDPAFFRIPAQEAVFMDPQQRLFLEESWKALEDAGYANKARMERRCGVFVGCGSSKYDTLMDDNTPPFAFWGNAESVIPARVSYFLDLQGPALAVNTACSSSLVTIHLACQSLRAGETEMALAGGVFLQPTAGFHQVSNRAGMLSSSGHCYPFDSRADGFVSGDGVGVLVLKRLADALRDGDHIHGVIKGSGVNQDGASNGIIAPNAAAQERLEREVYDRFAIDPESIQFLEAHGTGTIMGDVIEFGAITRAFRKYTDKTQFCAIGSVKANIGHTAAAAGVASVLKLLLALKNRQMPPGINFDKPNPGINMETSPFYVNREVKPWEPTEGMVRRAAVSSFSFSGTNAHIVIDEAPLPAQRPEPVQAGYLIVLSARTDDQLRQQVANLSAFLETASPLSISSLSYTLIVGRMHLAAKLACVVRNTAELGQLLQQWLSSGAAPGVFSAPASEAAPRERPSLAKYGNFCIEQLHYVDDEEALEHLATIADLYVQGYALDYAAVLPDGVGQRMSLPTYPFAREHYWIASTRRSPAAATAAPAAVTSTVSDAATSVAQAPVSRMPASPLDKIEGFLRHAAAQELGVSPGEVVMDLSYFDLGFTSLGVTNFIRKTNGLLATNLPPSIVFEHSSIRSLAVWLVENHATEVAAMDVGAHPLNVVVETEVAPPANPVGGTGAAEILKQIELATDSDDLADYEKLTF